MIESKEKKILCIDASKTAAKVQEAFSKVGMWAYLPSTNPSNWFSYSDVWGPCCTVYFHCCLLRNYQSKGTLSVWNHKMSWSHLVQFSLVINRPDIPWKAVKGPSYHQDRIWMKKEKIIMNYVRIMSPLMFILYIPAYHNILFSSAVHLQFQSAWQWCWIRSTLRNPI